MDTFDNNVSGETDAVFILMMQAIAEDKADEFRGCLEDMLRLSYDEGVPAAGAAKFCDSISRQTLENASVNSKEIDELKAELEEKTQKLRELSCQLTAQITNVGVPEQGVGGSDSGENTHEVIKRIRDFLASVDVDQDGEEFLAIAEVRNYLDDIEINENEMMKGV